MRSIFENARILEAGTSLFHSSASDLVGKLVASGAFDAKFSTQSGAMCFTPVPVAHTNCVADLSEDVVLYDFRKMTNGDWDEVQVDGYVPFAVAAGLGFDGRIHTRKHDDYTQLPEGGWTDEIAMFAESLYKIVNIRHLP